MIQLGLPSGTSRYLRLGEEMLGSDEVLLVQCDCDADAESISKSGAKLKSKGGLNDAVHLCLGDKTLTCKYVETTNSLFLVDIEEAQDDIENAWNGNPPVGCDHDIHYNQHSGLMSQMQLDTKAEKAPPIKTQAQSNFIVETVRCSVPVPEVQQLLQQHCVDGIAADKQNFDHTSMTWDELTASVMASDEDIILALQSIQAMPWPNITGDGWSLIDETLLLDSLEHILLTCIEHNLQLEEFEMLDLLSAIRAEDSPLSKALLVHNSCIAWYVLRRYGKQELAFAAWDAGSSSVRPQSPGAAQRVGFDINKVAKGCMHVVLHRYCQRIQIDPGMGKAVVNLAEIQHDWQDIFPAARLWHEGARLGEQEVLQWSDRLILQACHGFAIQRFRESHVELRILFESRLPPSAKMRFKVLFSIKDTWSLEEIEPYLDIHDCECANAMELLIRYSRTIRDGTGTAVFCAR